MNRSPILGNPWWLVATPLLMLLGALAAQFFLGWEPCTICVEIRFLLLASMLGGMAFLVLRKIVPRTATLAMLVVTGCSGGALFLNAKLSLLEHQVIEAFSCSPFPFYSDVFPLQDWLPYVFASGGVCGENDFGFLGVSFTTFTLLAIAKLWIVSMIELMRHIRGQN
jgi:disulfide bond formation protein DsbB